MTSETTQETLDRQNQHMTENLAKKVARLKDVDYVSVSFDYSSIILFQFKSDCKLFYKT